MTSDRENCGLSSLLPMSCRDRAEAFARRLHSRLTSLGSQDLTDSSDETSWLGSHEKTSVALSQPRHTNGTDKYLDLEVLESPGSPESETEDSDLHRLINADNLRYGECHCTVTREGRRNRLVNGLSGHTSNDSDSDVFYDTENDLDHRPVYVNGDTHSKSSKSNGTSDETGIDVNNEDSSTSNLDEVYTTSSDCTPQPSLSEDPSTLSLNGDLSSVSDVNGKQNGKVYSEGVELNGISPTNGEGYIICNGEIGRTYKTELTVETDIPKLNGSSDGSCDDLSTYVSSLSIENEFTVECPSTNPESRESSQESGTKKDEDDYDSEERIPRVRRCSSLKTGKTPPDTPSRKKIVRFADVLGLDLADVRTFLDEIPKIPTSAYEDLKNLDLDVTDSCLEPASKFHGIKVDKVLVPLFQQPGSLPSFLDRVRDNLVCLEHAVVDDPIILSVRGQVRVRNLDFHKSVHIRYSLDSWKTFADVQATYVENSCDGFSDKFRFTIYAHTLSVGQRLEFACRFSCKGCQYWDNNNGANYCFQCLPATNTMSSVQPITGVDEWGASFY